MSEEKYKRINIRLYPTKEQEVKMCNHVNHVRFIKNYFIQYCTDKRENEGIYYRDNTKSLNVLKKHLTQLQQQENFKWLKETNRHSKNQAIKDVLVSFEKLYTRQSKTVRLRKKGKVPNTYSIRNDLDENKLSRFRRISNREFKIEMLGKVKFSQKQYKKYKHIFDGIESKHKFTNPIVKHDGKYWYVSILYRDDLVSKNQVTELTNEVIGIDLGIKTLATCSNGKSYKNINKSSKVKKLEKKLNRLQRQLSRKYEINKDKLRIYHLDKEGKPVKTKTGIYKTSLLKTKNIIKLEKEIKLLHRKLKNIRNNHIHTMTKEIVEQYPSEIVIEDLKVSNMIKNKHLSKHISKCSWYTIRKYLEYKCEDRGILLTVANTYYPSSQTCSCCGKQLTKQDKLSLSQRTFTCECGTKIDRDINASINLKNYRYSKWYQDNIISQ
ncbi:endonuclease [Staphylococcus phage vB_SauH_SPJ2]|nr:endonuclease [Staphylococcus phage vB_SauH_SPJ2]